jgi:hypothetical protein
MLTVRSSNNLLGDSFIRDINLISSNKLTVKGSHSSHIVREIVDVCFCVVYSEGISASYDDLVSTGPCTCDHHIVQHAQRLSSAGPLGQYLRRKLES